MPLQDFDKRFPVCHRNPKSGETAEAHLKVNNATTEVLNHALQGPPGNPHNLSPAELGIIQARKVQCDDIFGNLQFGFRS